MTTGKGPANSPDGLTAMPCQESPAPGPATHQRALRTLSPAECYGLLGDRHACRSSAWQR